MQLQNPSPGQGSPAAVEMPPILAVNNIEVIYNHVVLVLMTYAFLQNLRRRRGKKVWFL